MSAYLTLPDNVIFHSFALRGMRDAFRMIDIAYEASGEPHLFGQPGDWEYPDDETRNMAQMIFGQRRSVKPGPDNDAWRANPVPREHIIRGLKNLANQIYKLTRV